MTDVLKEQIEFTKQKFQEQQAEKCLRTFEKSDQVMVHVPGMHKKLDAAWNSPYEVLERVSPVNYNIKLTSLGGRKRHSIVHINHTKKYTDVDVVVNRVVCAEVDSEDEVNLSQRNLKLKPRILSEAQQKALDLLLSDFPDLFSTEPGVTDTCSHPITVERGTRPIASQPYRLSSEWEEQVRSELDTLLEAGIIRPSTSPWASPTVPVKKPDGSLRLCVDFRRINSVTVPDPFPMPHIEDMLNRLGEAKYLSKINLKKGFYQIKVVDQDIPKTAFITSLGKYEFTRMPFGLRNAPATFQRCMEGVLAGQHKHSCPYIDDIVVHSKT